MQEEVDRVNEKAEVADDEDAWDDDSTESDSSDSSDGENGEHGGGENGENGGGENGENGAPTTEERKTDENKTNPANNAEGVRALPVASDHMETQPMDVNELPTPSEPAAPAPSPEMTTDVRRAKYQGQGVRTGSETLVLGDDPPAEKKPRKDDSTVLPGETPAPEALQNDEFSESGSGDDEARALTMQTMFQKPSGYVDRQSQLNMKKQSGKGKGRGRGRGSKKKPIAEDDDDAEEGKTVKPTKHEKPVAKEECPQKKAATTKRRLKGKQPEDVGPEWTDEMWEEYAKWQWGEDWQEWYEETTWDCWDHKKSFDRYANLEAQCSLKELDSIASKGKGCKESRKEAKTNKAEKQHKEKDHKASSKDSKNKTPESTANQEEAPSKKRKFDLDIETPSKFEVPRKPRDQANMIASFAKAACELGIKDPNNLTSDDKEKLRKNLPTNLEETRYNSYYKRPGFGLHVKAVKKDFGYFSVEGVKGNFLIRLAASWKAASMLATRMNATHIEELSKKPRDSDASILDDDEVHLMYESLKEALVKAVAKVRV
eukprot:s2921_g5.t1